MSNTEWICLRIKEDIRVRKLPSKGALTISRFGTLLKGTWLVFCKQSLNWKSSDVQEMALLLPPKDLILLLWWDLLRRFVFCLLSEWITFIMTQMSHRVGAAVFRMKSAESLQKSPFKPSSHAPSFKQCYKKNTGQDNPRETQEHAKSTRKGTSQQLHVLLLVWDQR